MQFAVSDSECADYTVVPFCTQSDAQKYTPLLMKHFRRWGLYRFTRRILYHPFKGSKAELLFILALDQVGTNDACLDACNSENVTLYLASLCLQAPLSPHLHQSHCLEDLNSMRFLFLWESSPWSLPAENPPPS